MPAESKDPHTLNCSCAAKRHSLPGASLARPAPAPSWPPRHPLTHRSRHHLTIHPKIHLLAISEIYCLSIWSPPRLRSPPLGVGQQPRTRPICIHNPDLIIRIPIRPKRNLHSIRSPATHRTPCDYSNSAPPTHRHSPQTLPNSSPPASVETQSSSHPETTKDKYSSHPKSK
jgi:hypothetical protein